MRRCRLLVTGASGSGTTTLARAVADAWAVPHVDADDYFWMPTDPPYLDKRPEAERVALVATLTCPVLRLDSALPREALRDEVLAWVPASH